MAILRFVFLLLAGVCCLLVPEGNAAVLYCDNLTDTEVQSKIDVAADGDVIVLPVGVSTWTTTVNVGNKAITIRGQGSDKTIINNGIAGAYSNFIFDVSVAAGKPLRITGIGFESSIDGKRGVRVFGNCGNWRIDHCRFLDLGTSIFATDDFGGLIDNCSFYYRTMRQFIPDAVTVVGNDTGWKQIDAWNKPLPLGTSNVVFIEDCLIDFNPTNVSDAADMVSLFSYNRGCSAFRYNRSNAPPEVHGACHTGYLGIATMEIYHNIMTKAQAYCGPTIWGGTGVIFSNTFSGWSQNLTMTFTDYRTCNMSQCGWPLNIYCNGTSPFDGNSAIVSGVHTGSSNQAVLKCAGMSWVTDQWKNFAVWNMTDYSKGIITSNTADTITASLYEGYIIADSGVHTGSNNSSVLVNSGVHQMAWDWHIDDCFVLNLTDGSTGYITSNDSNVTNISSVLRGGVENDWDNGDRYHILIGYPIASPKIPKVIDNDWDTGDTFKITDGWPCLGQFGVGPNLALEPFYEWDNTLDGNDADLVNRGNCDVLPYNDHMREGRDYYNDTQRPGYVPYTYPHPLRYFWQDTVDTSSPTAPAQVRDGASQGSDISSVFSTTTLSANWDVGSDADSGISGYRYAIGTSAGATNITNGWLSNGANSVTKTGLALTVGTTYYFSVKAVNGASLESGATNSNGQFVTGDATPPSAPGTVRDGTGTTDISSTTSRTQLSANWTAATDNESGISGYKYAIGTTAGGTNTANWITLGNVLTVTKTGLSLTIGTTYYFSVKAVNGAGLSGPTANSNGQVVLSTAVADTTAPSAPGTVRDGPTAGTDASFTYSTTTLSANWTASTDNESGITNYQFSIGTTPGATNITNWITLGNVLTVTKAGLTLTAGTTYYFSVKAINGAGLSGPTTNSNGQYIKAINPEDTTPPSPPSQVRDGTSATADTGYTASTTELSANWTAATDNESGISNYQFSIGTTPGGTDVTNGWKDNGAFTEVTETGLTLAVGTTYYFSVKAVNGVSLEGSATNSNGQCVVSSVVEIQPVISDVQSINITASAVTIIWTTDKQATSQVEYGLTVIYGNSTTEDSSLVTAHSVVITGLTAGQTYHYRVISKDSNGNQAVSTDYNFTTLLTQNPVSGIRVYPNPHDFSSGAITFKFIENTGGEVKIYTMTGKLVKKLSGTSGKIDWDGRNEDGQKAIRGIYIYKITEVNGDSVTGKLAVK